MWELLDSNFFQTLIIFIVSFSAFISYKVSKNDERRNAASVILNEIRDIEIEIENIKSVENFINSSPVITINSWDKNKYLFSQFLDQDEFKLINDFYKVSQRIEEQRNLIREQINVGFIEKSRVIQQKAADIAYKLVEENVFDSNEFDSRINKIHSFMKRNTPGLEGSMPKNIIQRLASNFKTVTTSTAGLKLKRIADSKRFFFI